MFPSNSFFFSLSKRTNKSRKFLTLLVFLFLFMIFHKKFRLYIAAAFYCSFNFFYFLSLIVSKRINKYEIILQINYLSIKLIYPPRDFVKIMMGFCWDYFLAKSVFVSHKLNLDEILKKCDTKNTSFWKKKWNHLFGLLEIFKCTLSLNRCRFIKNEILKVNYD